MLLRAPEDWPQPVVAVVAMVLLAALDLGGTFAAKEAVQRQSAGFAGLGAGLFLVLFWVYVSSLEVAELSSVTFGWIVLLQVGVVLLDRFRYGVTPASGAWVAMLILLAAEAYLILAPGSVPGTAAPSSAPGDHQAVQAVHHDLAELGDTQHADPDPGDQQSVADGFVPGVRTYGVKHGFPPEINLPPAGR
jgi:hypothetical protein